MYSAEVPVYWSTAARSVVADAEICIKPLERPSYYFKLRLADTRLNERTRRLCSGQGKSNHTESLLCTDVPVYLVSWSTTPYTLPANRAVALNPDTKYAILRAKPACRTFQTLAQQPAPDSSGGGDERLEEENVELWIVGSECVDSLLRTLNASATESRAMSRGNGEPSEMFAPWAVEKAGELDAHALSGFQ